MEVTSPRRLHLVIFFQHIISVINALPTEKQKNQTHANKEF